MSAISLCNDNVNSSELMRCAICFEEQTNTPTVTLHEAERVKHIFHRSCFKTWQQTKMNRWTRDSNPGQVPCPLCNRPVTPIQITPEASRPTTPVSYPQLRVTLTRIGQGSQVVNFSLGPRG